MRIEINRNAKTIIRMLEVHGFVAFCVGGCVRDAIMGIEPKDWDLATNARPEQVTAIFDKVNPSGIQHGTVTVVINHEGFEVTTFRKDGDYSDGRHPDNVEYSTTILEDVSRRDFTMNAMFCGADGEVFDDYDGMKDIRDGIIRFIGEPVQRITEDALRMLRAVRFASQFGFKIDLKGRTAILKNANRVSVVSQERIRDELVKIITSTYAFEGVIDLYDLGLLHYILPELELCFSVGQNNPHHIYNVGDHIANAVGSEYVPNTTVALAMLLHDIGKPATKSTIDGIDHFYSHGEASADLALSVLERLKFGRETIKTVCTLVLYHNAEIHPTGKSVRKWLSRVGEENLRFLLQIRMADADAQALVDFEESAKLVDAIYTVLDEVLDAQQAFTLKDLAVNGEDLAELGIPRDRRMGLALNTLLNAVIENPELNDKEILIKMVEQVSQE